MMSSMVGERRPPVRLGIGVDLDHVVLPAGEEGDEVDLGLLDGKAHYHQSCPYHVSGGGGGYPRWYLTNPCIT